MATFLSRCEELHRPKTSILAGGDLPEQVHTTQVICNHRCAAFLGRVADSGGWCHCIPICRHGTTMGHVGYIGCRSALPSLGFFKQLPVPLANVWEHDYYRVVLSSIRTED